MSKLPAGCRFWIWPQYRLEFEGRGVTLTPTLGEVMALFLANPGKRLCRADMVEARYEHLEDGGPLCADDIQRRHILLLRRRLTEHGINVLIESKRGRRQFVFHGFELCPLPAVEFVRVLEAA